VSHLLLRAARGEVVERVPVWAMRQAGRWDPVFAKLRAGRSFFEFSENVELAAQASLAPRRFGVDAIILFYDITTLAVAMGLPFKLVPHVGPVPDRPVRTRTDVDRLAPRPAPDRYGHVLELLSAVREELAGDLPVLVFAGAPLTLASYCIAVGKDLAAVRAFAAEQPDTWAGLLDRIGEATVSFLDTLVAAGADAYQLFDSWAGGLTRDEYDRWSQPHHRAVFAGVRGVPRFLFVKECPHVDAMAASGADVVSLGVTHDPGEVRRRYPNLCLQGNVDDQLVRTGTPLDVIRATQQCLNQLDGRRHVLNLSHGMAKDAAVENFAAYVATARARVSRVG
jgi:uroporphyrinogen decarboxylase